MTLNDMLDWLHDRNYEIMEVHLDASDGSYTITMNGVFADDTDESDEAETRSEG